MLTMRKTIAVEWQQYMLLGLPKKNTKEHRYLRDVDPQ